MNSAGQLGKMSSRSSLGLALQTVPAQIWISLMRKMNETAANGIWWASARTCSFHSHQGSSFWRQAVLLWKKVAKVSARKSVLGI